MQHLDVVHDGSEAESQVGRCDAQEHPATVAMRPTLR